MPSRRCSRRSTWSAPDEIWCLGDLVGYGPRPNRCCALVAERADVVPGRKPRPRRPRPARPRDLLAGRGALSAALDGARCSSRRRARSSSRSGRSGEREGVGLFHASPRDPVWEYVLSPGVALRRTRPRRRRRSSSSGTATSRSRSSSRRATLATATRRGHGARARRRPLAPQPGLGRPAARRRPAGGLARCSTSTRGRAAFRRVEYDVEKTQAEIRERGLPEALAARLEHGV